MGFVGDVVGSIFGGGSAPAEAGTQAANIQAQYQRDALNYLKQQEQVPQQFPGVHRPRDFRVRPRLRGGKTQFRQVQPGEHPDGLAGVGRGFHRPV